MSTTVTDGGVPGKADRGDDDAWDEANEDDSDAMDVVEAVEAVDELRLWRRLVRADMPGGPNSEAEGEREEDEHGDVHKAESDSSEIAARTEEDMGERDVGDEVEQDAEGEGDTNEMEGDNVASSANKAAACVIPVLR